LNFTTGANILDAGPWTFDSGGNLEISGTAKQGDTVVASGVLASGSFGDSGGNVVAGSGTTLNFSGIGIDDKNEDLSAFYGEENPFDFSATTIQLGTATISADGSFIGTVTNADFDNVSTASDEGPTERPTGVAEPGTLLLMSLGLVGFAFFRRNGWL
jgi:hypothetical protein